MTSRSLSPVKHTTFTGCVDRTEIASLDSETTVRFEKEYSKGITSTLHVLPQDHTKAVCNVGSLHALVVNGKEITPPSITRTEIIDNLQCYFLCEKSTATNTRRDSSVRKLR